MPTQEKDIYSPFSPAISYASPGQTWKIANGVDVGSGGTITIYSSVNDAKLVNRGHIYSFESSALYFIGNNPSIVNKAMGIITAEVDAIHINSAGSHASVANEGTAIGGAIGLLSLGPGDLEVDNSGDLYGYEAGLRVTATVAGSTPGPEIDNEGTIHSGMIGVDVHAPGLKTTVTNASGAKIKGPDVAIHVDAGRLLLKNHGVVKGDVVSEAGVTKDKIVNTGSIKGDVHLGTGNDTFNNKDGQVGKLYGESGNDKFILGSHTEKIVFDAGLAFNIDRVKHFESGKDKFLLDMDVFGALTPGQLPASQFNQGNSAGDVNDHIIYHKSTGALYYDFDGTDPIPQVQFAQLDAGTTLHASDFDVIA